MQFIIDSKTGEARVEALGDSFTKVGHKGKSAFSEIGSAAQNLQSRIAANISPIKTLGTAFGAWQVSRLAKDVLDVAASFELMEIKLDALTKGRGKETLERINAWALDMPVNTRKAVETFSMMQAMGLDPTIARMQTLVDVSSLFGDEAMPRVARALGQMQSLGKVSAEELNQLAEAGINARKYLSEAFGMTVEELQKSQVEIKDIIEVIWKGLDADYSGSAKKAMSSWQGLTATFQSYLEEIARRFMDAGVFEALKTELGGINAELSNWISQNGELLKQKVPEYVDQTRTALSSIWDILTYDPAIIEYGMVGLAIGGRKGAVIMGALGHMKSWVENLSAAMGMASQGIISWKDIATANFKELEALVAKGEKAIENAGQPAEQTFQNVENAGDKAGKTVEAATEKMADGLSLADIQARALEKSMDALSEAGADLFKELYDHTGLSEFAEKAIAAQSKILDKEEEKWQKILGSDEDAHMLRLKREQEFRDSLFGMIDEVVDKEQEAADERVRINQDMVGRKEDDEYSGSSLSARETPGSGKYTGMPEGFAGYEWQGMFFETYAQMKAAWDRVEQAEEERAKVQEELNREIARAQEEVVRELEREAEARRRTVDSLFGSYSSFLQGRERRSWTAADYFSEYDRLADSFRNAGKFDDQVDVLNDMLDVLRSLDSKEQEQLRQQETMISGLGTQGQSINAWLMSLATGAQAPSQSAAAWGVQYQDLYGKVDMAANTGLSEFLSFAKDYLSFQQTYAPGDYTSIYQSVLSDVNALGTFETILEKLYGLGVSGPADELNKLARSIKEVGGAALLATGEQGVQALISKLGPDENGLIHGFNLAGGAAGTLGSKVETGTSAAIDQFAVFIGGIKDLVPTSADLIAQINPAAIAADIKTDIEELAGVAEWQNKWTQVGVNQYTSGMQTGVKYYWIHPDFPDMMFDDKRAYATGGLTSGRSLAGEAGPEWIVPTYEPERSRFLKDVGADPEAIGKAIASRLAPLLSGSGQAQIIVPVIIDGREIARIVAEQAARSGEMVNALKRALV
jgi:tape measure domain-containing protein